MHAFWRRQHDGGFPRIAGEQLTACVNKIDRRLARSDFTDRMHRMSAERPQIARDQARKNRLARRE
ncbi:hypothetical protein [Paraburkholderia sp. Ac-20340]|uniref:hypothetical protein n=1 Tax=Paraburkholderia sp. Ac-20340 TaxID=2703888 RepID=UPI00321665B1